MKEEIHNLAEIVLNLVSYSLISWFALPIILLFIFVLCQLRVLTPSDRDVAAAPCSTLGACSPCWTRSTRF